MEQGAHLLVKRALAGIAPGAVLRVEGASPDWDMHLVAWCRQQGHEAEVHEGNPRHVLVTRGPFQQGRWAGAAQAGHADAATSGGVAEHADAGWGLAARGALVEAGSPPFTFRLARKSDVWAETAGALYRQALGEQWDPETAIDWQAPFALPDDVEDAVVQVMTYLVENENAALLVPARFMGQVHPHYREVVQLLAIQCADEARHVEVFTRRALLHR
ncbi:MAG: ferritin-like domain-containing protein, partial [Comamonadaceae bacterium]